MKTNEFHHILAALIILTAVIGFSSLYLGNYSGLLTALLFSVIILAVNILAKKLVARSLDSDVEHRIWSISRYGLRKPHRLRTEVSAGIFVPLFFTIITLGMVKVMSILVYETKVLKRRAAKRFGYYSFTAMTDWHNALIGAAGIIALLALSIIAYIVPGAEPLAKLAAYYAFFNIIPWSNLDGTQIFFGSRVLYAVLATITIIFTAYSLVII